MKTFRNICLFLLLINIIWQAESRANQDLPATVKSGVQTLLFTDLKQVLPSLKRATQILRSHETSDDDKCKSCKNVFDEVLSYRKSGASKDSMVLMLKKLCSLFTEWGQVACDGFTDIEIDTILYIVDNRKGLTSERICAIVMQSTNCKDTNENHWTIDIPPLAKTDQNWIQVKRQENELKILHLTDFHYDPLYQPGSNAVCDVPLCCQAENGPPKDPKNAAGYWGDYNVCDMPWHTITDFMSYLKRSEFDFDYVYYTGDIISHKSWATSKDHNVAAIRALYEIFSTTFGDTPFYPILGNHEPHPTDFYSPGNLTSTKVSTQWIFDLAADEWSSWLPEETNSTILAGGYYTVLVKPGFRIVALNSNVCFTSNLWLIYDDEDPYDQLKWLVQVLLEAEKNGEKVHLLSHIPPGEVTCMRQWTVQFRRIINRFAPIISAQFNGHTHYDELRVFYDLQDTKRVVNVAFNAGSFTTFVGLNPNFRLYYVDPQSLRVLDYDHYTFNLTEANKDKDKSPEWYKLYSLKQEYGLVNTELQDFGDLVERMSKNDTLVKRYFELLSRESPIELAKGCDKKCLLQQLCSITAVEAQKAIDCLEITKTYNRIIKPFE